jgi:uncharacterized protein
LKKRLPGSYFAKRTKKEDTMPNSTPRAPGVYIEEQVATGPIAGVSTSVTAFIGPTRQGPDLQPVLITNWTQFTTTFGGYTPRSFMAPAVRGFLDNGGSLAYIVRVGGGTKASLELNISGPPAISAIQVTARQEGVAGDKLQVSVQHTHIVPAEQQAVVTRASAPIVSAENNVITLQDDQAATGFAPGDIVTIESGVERVQVVYCQKNQLFLASNLSGTYEAGKRASIANLVTEQHTFRIQKSTGIEAGSVINLAQGQTQETHKVERMAGDLVTLEGEGLVDGFALDAASPPVAVTTNEFTLMILHPGSTPEIFANLSMDHRHSRYFTKIVQSEWAEVEPSTRDDLLLLPDAINATNLAHGEDDDVEAIGLPDYQKALAALANTEDISLVCVPGCIDPIIQAAVVQDCEKLGTRFAILDGTRAPDGKREFDKLLLQRAQLESQRGFAALYYPWITVANWDAGSIDRTVLVSPSGHLAGVYARSDSQRGVHKAPANEFIVSAVGLEFLLNDADQGQLNSAGIDILRIFPGQARPLVWGARTTAPKDQLPWRFVNVRRLFIFIEESIRRGIRWAVFEPNNTTLWKQLERTITDFLTRVWGSGALFGRTASEAFYVKIDDELNPPDVQAAGEILIEIGIAPVRPAEFVIVRIAMWSSGSSVNE